MKVFLLCLTAFGEIGADSSNQEKGMADEAVTTSRRSLFLCIFPFCVWDGSNVRTRNDRGRINLDWAHRQRNPGPLEHLEGFRNIFVPRSKEYRQNREWALEQPNVAPTYPNYGGGGNIGGNRGSRGGRNRRYSDSTGFPIWAGVIIAIVVVVVLFAFCCICRKRRAKNREAQQARRAGVRAPVGRPIGSTFQMTGFVSRRTTRRDPDHVSLRIPKHNAQNSLSECMAQSHHMQESRRSSGREPHSSLSNHMPQSLVMHKSRSSSKHKSQSLSKRKSQSSSKSSKDKSRRLKSSSARRHLKKGISEERTKRAATGLE